MALPALDKTWQYNVNNRVTSSGSGSNDKKAVLLAIKNGLKAFASNPWTVAGSSNSSLAGLDGVDRWSTISDIVFGGGTGVARSWILFNQVGVGQILWDLVSPNPADALNMTLVWSPGSLFTGGTISARPTATDETVYLNQGVWNNGQTNSYEHLWYLWHSTDGHMTRILVRSLGSIMGFTTFASFERPKSPIAQWTNPKTISWFASTNVLGTTTWTQSARIRGNKPPSGVMNMFVTCEGWQTQTGNIRLGLPNDLTNEYEIFPLALACEEVGARGRHSELFDRWLVTSSLADGDTMPSDNSRQFVVIEDHLFSWNGTVFVLS